MKRILLIILILLAIGAVIFYKKDQTSFDGAAKQEQNDIEEKGMIDAYIRSHIMILAPEQPVLGGTWYVTSIEVATASKTGIVTYEDGHIETEASFTYQISEDGISVVLKKKL